jgi:P-type Cu+ transporter
MEHTNATAKIAKDPVCGMTVDPSKAAATVEFDGQPYYFCSKGCVAKFQQNPVKFLAANATTAQHTATTQHTHHQIAPASPTQVATPRQSANTVATAKAGEGVRYTCPMHPQIVEIGPGSCPICGMALEPLDPLAEVEADPEYEDRKSVV